MSYKGNGNESGIISLLRFRLCFGHVLLVVHNGGLSDTAKALIGPFSLKRPNKDVAPGPPYVIMKTSLAPIKHTAAENHTCNQIMMGSLEGRLCDGKNQKYRCELYLGLTLKKPA